MKKIGLSAILLIFLISAFASCSCGGIAKTVNAEMTAMDTYMSFSVSGQESEKSASQIKELVKKLDRELSVTDKSSDIYKINENGGGKLSENGAELVKKSLELCGRVNGSLDISILPVVREWGFISGDHKIPQKAELDELLKKVDYKKIRLNGTTVSLEKSMEIDLGSVAKGFAADKSAEILRKNKTESALLNFGGTIAAVGKKPDGSKWKVGIADPDKSSDYFGFVECEDKVVSTSGGYERNFVGEDGKTYIHIIDPFTGKPVEGELESVTVLCDSGTTADALSTALYVKGLGGAAAEYKKRGDFDFVIMTSDGNIFVTEGIKSSFRLADGFKATVKTVKK